MDFSEDVLHFIWKHRLFNQGQLTTFSGKSLRIHKVGRYNQHAGPDFETASLSLNGVDWVGNVEIHLKSSDWDAHMHHKNHAYDNVILHVVFTHDREVYRGDGTSPETLVIGPLIQQQVLSDYQAMINNRGWIPCANLIHHVPPFHINQWLSRVMVERLLKKAQGVLDLLNQYQGDWEEVCYIVMARNFGFSVNSDAFEMLAKSLPRKWIAKNKNKPLAIEALLFGQSGMLSQTFKQEYPSLLRKEYDYLCQAYKIKPMEESVWKFLRMRPSNFPSMRIAQFAALCFSCHHLFARIIDTENINLCRKWFQNLPVNDFWKSHYHFKKPSRTLHGNQIGKMGIDSILLNTVPVMLFAYGMYTDNPCYVDRAVNLLESLPPEQNSIVQQFDALGVKSKNAADTQAALHLKTIYCEGKRCLNCGIGLQIIKR